MASITALIAGFSGGPGQNHQGDMYVPALTSIGVEVADIWVPTMTSPHELQNAKDVAKQLGVGLQVSANPQTNADCAIVCLVGAERQAFLSYAAKRDLPVLLDKPTLDSTDCLTTIITYAGKIYAEPHFGYHPSFARALAAIRNAEIGLLRGVHVDLIVANGDGAFPGGELRNLGVYPVDLMRKATGPATVRLQAYQFQGGLSFLGQTERDVVVSTHVSRTSKSAGGAGVLRAMVRILGTHGSLRVDLTQPAVEVRCPEQRMELPFGDSSVTSHLRAFIRMVQGKEKFASTDDLVVVSKALDDIAESASLNKVTVVTW